MTLPMRLADAMAAANFNQSSLAREVGVTPAAIQQLVTGKSKQSSHLPKIAKTLNVSEAWLRGEAAERQRAPAEGDDLAVVPTFSLASGQAREAQALGYAAVDTRLGIADASERELALFTEIGTSMMPTLMPDDRVLVDLADTEITRQNQLWLLGLGDYSLFRRVIQLGGDAFRLIADNPAEPALDLGRSEFVVTGRVVWFARGMDV